MGVARAGEGDGSMERLTFEGNFCDIAMCRENPCPYNGMCSQRQTWERLKKYEDTGLEPEEIKAFAEDVAYQFGHYFPIKDILYLSTCGLSTLESAFDILGWNDPHPVPECECEVPGCHEYANCGTKTKDGYKRVCGKHFAELTREEAEAALALKCGDSPENRTD